MAKEKASAADLIREALKAGVDKPQAIVEWVKEHHKREVTIGNVNSVKSKSKTKKGGKGKPRAKKAASDGALDFGNLVPVVDASGKVIAYRQG